MEKVKIQIECNLTRYRKTWQDLVKFARTKEDVVVPAADGTDDDDSDIGDDDNIPIPITSYRLIDPKPKKKKSRVQNKKKLTPIKVDNLLTMCMKVICKYIDNVEGFGLVPPELQSAICKMLARERKMNSSSLKLFLSEDVQHLSLSSASGMHCLLL